MSKSQFNNWLNWLNGDYGDGAFTKFQLREISAYSQPSVRFGQKVM